MARLPGSLDRPAACLDLDSNNRSSTLEQHPSKRNPEELKQPLPSTERMPSTDPEAAEAAADPESSGNDEGARSAATFRDRPVPQGIREGNQQKVLR